ncbi:399_t:CDS:2, partial [Cetraspora pellucida]
MIPIMPILYIVFYDRFVKIIKSYSLIDSGNTTNRKHSASLPQKIPLLYDPKAPLGSRFTRMAEAKYVRVYHSSATLIPDGTVFVTGSNPNKGFCDTCEYPTEYRTEIFTPPYLLNGTPRPTIRSIAGTTAFNSMIPIQTTYGEIVTILINLDDPTANIAAALIHHGFATHSQHMSARYVSLQIKNQTQIPSGYSVDVILPPYPNIMPPGRHTYLYILNKGTPANTAIEINLKR